MDFATIARGCYLEGLSVTPDCIWVSDAVAGGVFQLFPDGSRRTWLEDKRWVGSLLDNGDGRLLVSGEGGILWFDTQDGSTGMLVESVGGVPLPGANEMLPDGRGGLYFGTSDVPAIARAQPPGPAQLLHLQPDGEVRVLLEGLRFSNGIAVSPDGRTLYHCETFVGPSAYPIEADGTLGEGRLLLDKPDCDGLVLDVEGNLWIAGFRTHGFVRLAPDGSRLADFPLPGGSTSLRFGGDGRDLYCTYVGDDAARRIVAGEPLDPDGSQILRTRSEVAGRIVPPAGVKIPR